MPARRSWRRFTDARIRTKVILVLLLPVLVILSLAGIAVAGSVRSAGSAASVERLARFGTVLSDSVDELQHERDAAAIWLSANSVRSRAVVTQQVARTDQTLSQLRAAQLNLGTVPGAVSAGLQQLGEQLSQLPATRQDLLSRKLGVPESQLRYTNVIEKLLTLAEEVSSGSQNGDLVLRVRALAAFSRVKEDAAQELALVDGFLRQKAFGPGQYRSYFSALSTQYSGYQQFIALATRKQREVVATTLSGKQMSDATRLESAIARGDPNVLNISVTDWSAAMNAKLDRMKAAEAMLSGDVVNLAVNTSHQAVRQAILDSAFVLLALLVALGVSILLARNIVRPVSRLRAEALATAYERLPAAVQRLRNPDALHSNVDTAELASQAAPKVARPENELGHLGKAFDAMHSEAVRIALEQATLRRQVAGMVVNLSRRSRAMVNRLLAQLDRMEANEEDSDRLAELFRLDHLATRMRRNDESLLVLAGARVPRQRSESASLTDVVRAAQSEVEQYTRINVDAVDPDIYVIGAATDDLSHLLAELMENATQFSPPSTQVTVRARRASGGVILQVDDEGIGVVSEELEELNRRLHQAASVEVAADRRLGLFVVGRLAARYGVQATLLRLESGTRAEVRLPAGLLLSPELVPTRDEPRLAGTVPARPLVDRPLRPSRMQYWAGGTPDGKRIPLPLPRFDEAEADLGDIDGDGGMADAAGALPRRVPGALLFPGTMRPAEAPEPRPINQDRPDEVRRSLSSLRRGVERGRPPEPRRGVDPGRPVEYGYGGAPGYPSGAGMPPRGGAAGPGAGRAGTFGGADGGSAPEREDYR